MHVSVMDMLGSGLVNPRLGVYECFFFQGHKSEVNFDIT